MANISLIITLIVTLLTGLIGGFGAVAASERLDNNQQIKWGTVGFIACIGASVGFVLSIILFSFVFNDGPNEEAATSIPVETVIVAEPTVANSIATNTPQTISPETPNPSIPFDGNWVLNPNLPEPSGLVGWLGSDEPMDFGGGVWSRDVRVTIEDDELVLIFGGLAAVGDLGEVGTATSCFVIASRGPLRDVSVDLMGARLEVHQVDVMATAVGWAAEKVKVLREVYPTTCGRGVDVVVGK